MKDNQLFPDLKCSRFTITDNGRSQVMPVPAISGGTPLLRPACPWCHRMMKREEYEGQLGELFYAWSCDCGQWAKPRIGPTETKEAQ